MPSIIETDIISSQGVKHVEFQNVIMHPSIDNLKFEPELEFVVEDSEVGSIVLQLSDRQLNQNICNRNKFSSIFVVLHIPFLIAGDCGRMGKYWKLKVWTL